MSFRIGEGTSLALELLLFRGGATMAFLYTMLYSPVRPRQIGCPGARGYQLSWGGATTAAAARARRATSCNASVITTLRAVHPFIWENNTLLLAG